MHQRGNFLLTDMFSCPYCTIFIRARGFAVASKLKFFLMGHGHLCAATKATREKRSLRERK